LFRPARRSGLRRDRRSGRHRQLLAPLLRAAPPYLYRMAPGQDRRARGIGVALRAGQRAQGLTRLEPGTKAFCLAQIQSRERVYNRSTGSPLRGMPKHPRHEQRESGMHIGMGTGFAHQRGHDYPDARFFREEFENCVLAEELGFDSVWITEHHFSDYSFCTNPLQALTYLAGRTKRVLLGTQVIVVPWHDPVRLAEQIILLDHVSNGRGVFGFGRGLARHEFRGLRIDQSKARELYNEILSLVIPAMETGFMEGGEIFKQPR